MHRSMLRVSLLALLGAALMPGLACAEVDAKF
jgi:hypothetical protein